MRRFRLLYFAAFPLLLKSRFRRGKMDIIIRAVPTGEECRHDTGTAVVGAGKGPAGGRRGGAGLPRIAG